MAKQITVTKEGLKRLEDELNERKSTKRDEIKEAIRIARGFGDLSENSEYDEAKDAQAQNERRILELEEMLKHVTIVEESATDRDKVTAGKVVKVLNLNKNEEMTYKVVGPTETDPFKHFISDQSPIGVALVGKKVGDEAVAETPKGAITFKILEIDIAK